MADVCQTTPLNDNSQQNARYQANRADKCSQEAMQLLGQQSKMGTFKSPDLGKVSSLDLGSSSDLGKLYGGGQTGDQKLGAVKHSASGGESSVAGQAAQPKDKTAAGTEAHGSDSKGSTATHKQENVEHANAKDHSRSQSDSHHGKGPQSGQHEIHESKHTVQKGETLEGIAKKTLGPHAKKEDIDRYVSVMQDMNNITDPKKLQAGAQLEMPGRKADGTLYGRSVDTPDTVYKLHPNGDEEWSNTKDGTHSKRTYHGNDGSYDEECGGQKPHQNYHVSYDGSKKEKTTSYGDGSYTVEDKNGMTKTQNRDGSTVTTWPGGYSERATSNKGAADQSNSDRTVVTQGPDGATTVKNEGDGSGYSRKPESNGSYTEHGWGKKPEQNYDEKYNSKDGSTTRTDATGTTTTSWSDGTKKVEHADKTGYQTNRDGSEDHWNAKGDKVHKPAEDLSENKQVKQARENMDKAIDKSLDQQKPPLSEKEKADKKQAFHDQQKQFEDRAKKDHLAAEEVAKTYEQTTRLLAADNGKVKDPAQRYGLAQDIMQHAANPDTVKQGNHDTCNVTTVAERTYSRNPSKMAEMVATTALTGEWKAPDGKTIKIDDLSLNPGREEGTHPPATGDRSFATQITNLVMVNDATQRRNPPEYYRQIPTKSVKDTGERLFDGNGTMLKETVDQGGRSTQVPIKAPTLSDSEIGQIGERLTGDKHFFVDSVTRDAGQGDATVPYADKQQLQNALKQMKDQQQLPAILGVDSSAPPFNTGGKGGEQDHVVCVTDYDEANKRVKISDPANPKNDKWVSLDELYKNMNPDDGKKKEQQAA